MTDEVNDNLSPTVEQILSDPSASAWIKSALRWALLLDPVDAANDAEVLAEALNQRCEQLLERHLASR